MLIFLDTLVVRDQCGLHKMQDTPGQEKVGDFFSINYVATLYFSRKVYLK